MQRIHFSLLIGVSVIVSICLLGGCSPGEPTVIATVAVRPIPFTETSTVVAIMPSTATPTRLPPEPAAATATATATRLPSATLQSTVTATLTASATQSPTVSATPMPSATASVTATSSPTSTPTPYTCIVVADALNVREGPGLVYDVIARVHLGDELLPAGRNATGDWFYVSLRAGQFGWVYAGLVEYGGDASALTVVTPPPAPTAVATTYVTPTPIIPAAQYVPAGPARADTSHPCPG